MTMKHLSLPFFAGAVLLSQAAQAHTGHHPVNGFMSGFLHPVMGLDHLLAMFCVGMWAAQRKGEFIWALPLAFVSFMALGGLLGIIGMPMPAVETGIAISVLLLGAMVAFSVQLPLLASVGGVAAFALLHGHAHGAEAAGANVFTYGIGFVLATALLHAAGVVCALAATRERAKLAVRLSGGAIAAAGLALVVMTL